VRCVRVQDVEFLSQDGLAQAPGIPEGISGSSGMGHERPRPSERQKSLSERAAGHESELRFDAGRDQGRRLIENHGGRACPFLARHQIQNAHARKLSAISSQPSAREITAPVARAES